MILIASAAAAPVQAESGAPAEGRIRQVDGSGHVAVNQVSVQVVIASPPVGGDPRFQAFVID
jgi:hypothetical protein